MVGIDPNNILGRWLKARWTGQPTDDVLADAKREHAGTLKHSIEDKLGALTALVAENDPQFVEHYKAEKAAIEELRRAVFGGK